MNWNEFKQLIDKQIEEKGLSPDTTIVWIDISFPSNDPEDARYPKLRGDEKNGLSISE